MRVEEKKEEIQKYLEELNEITPKDFEEYKVNFEKKAACERYFEKIVGDCVDLAFLIIKEKNFKIPREEGGVFFVLAEEKIINKNLAEKLMEAKGMRNIIAHEYGKIDDEIVFNSICEELTEDITKFLDCLG
jgi:uncharacterized protein YutE (UPF0331/DUF86 family)